MTEGRRNTAGTEGLGFLFLVLYPLLAALVVPLVLAGASRDLRHELFRDPASELGVLWGIFSYFGILMWAASTAWCATARAFLTRTAPSHPSRPWFLASALLSGALTLDDTFVIHEIVLPKYVGIPEVLVYLGYSIAISWYLIRFRREILNRADSVLFLVSVLFLGSSVAMDVIHWAFPLANGIEDLTKLLGITAWMYFFFRATLDVATQNAHSGPTVSQ